MVLLVSSAVVLATGNRAEAPAARVPGAPSGPSSSPPVAPVGSPVASSGGKLGAGVIATVAGIPCPTAVVFDPKNGMIYVGAGYYYNPASGDPSFEYGGSCGSDGGIYEVNPATDTVIGRVPMGGGGIESPTALAVNNTTGTVYAANGSGYFTFQSGSLTSYYFTHLYNDDCAYVIYYGPRHSVQPDAADGCYGDASFVFDPNTQTLYLVSAGDPNGTVVGSHPHPRTTHTPNVNCQGTGMTVFDPVTTYLYQGGGPGLCVSDPVANETIGTIGVPNGAEGPLSFYAPSSDIYGIDHYDANLTVVYPSSDLAGPLTGMPGNPFPTCPGDLAADAAAGLVLVTDACQSALYLYQPSSSSFIFALPLGAYVIGVGIDPVAGTIWVTGYNTGSLFVLRTGTVYPATFVPKGLPAWRSWSVDTDGYTQSAPGDESISTWGLDGTTLPFTVLIVPGFSATPGSGSLTISGAGVNTSIAFKSIRTLFVYSEFSGKFFQNASFSNTYGLYTSSGNHAPEWVAIYINGQNETLAKNTSFGGPWNVTLNMGSLAPAPTLTAKAVYAGFTITKNLTLPVYGEPAWLSSFVGGGSFQFTRNVTGEWNNTFSQQATTAFPLADYFGTALSSLFLSGNTDLIPDMDLKFSISASGEIDLDGTFSVGNLSVSVGNVEAEFEVTIEARGVFAVNTSTGTFTWKSATLNITVDGGVSVTEPIFGFSIPDTGKSVGLNLVLSLNASYTVEFLLKPATSSSQDVFPGLAIAMQAISADIDVGFSAAIEFEIPYVVTLEAEGKLDFDMHLELTAPYDAGGTLTGTVTLSADVVDLVSVSWSDSISTSWGAGGGPNLAGIFERAIAPAASAANYTNFTFIPRYYNTSGYDTLTWTSGSWGGEFLHDPYPFGTPSVASVGSTAYLAMTTDNVSRAQAHAYTWAVYAFNSSTRGVASVRVALPAGELEFDPVLHALPNGSIVAVWKALPFSGENATSPLASSGWTLQSADYSPGTGAWSRVANWSSWGVLDGYAADATPQYGRLAVVTSGEWLAATESLLLYNLTSGALLSNVSVSGVTGIDAFSATTDLAALNEIGGGAVLLNASTGASVTMPDERGFALTSLTAVGGAPGLLSAFYTGANVDLAVLVNSTSGLVLDNVSIVRNSLAAQYFELGGTVFLLWGNVSGLHVGIVVGSNATSYWSAAAPGVYRLTGSLVGSSLLVQYATNYGVNDTRPLLNDSFHLLPLVPPRSPSGFALQSLGPAAVKLTWSEFDPTDYDVTQYVVYVGNSTTGLEPLGAWSAPRSSVTFTHLVPNPYYFAVAAVSPVGPSLLSSVRGVVPVEFEEAGLPNGTPFEVTLGAENVTVDNSSAVFEALPGSYDWSVRNVSGYSVDPRTGSATAAYPGVLVAISFHLKGTALYTVTFKETGLPKHAFWAVALGNGQVESSTGTTVVFHEAAGNDSFEIEVPSGYNATPSAGTYSVSTSALVEKIAFAPVAGPVARSAVAPSPGSVVIAGAALRRSFDVSRSPGPRWGPVGR